MRRRRWKSRPNQKNSNKKFLLLILFIFSLFSFQTFIFFEKNLRPPLMQLAKMKLTQIATQAINAAVSDRINKSTNLDQLIDWKTDQKGKVTGMILNSAEDMKITENTINTVQTLLNNLQTTNESIPIGEAFNSAIFASFGPSLPIKMKPLGAVQVDLNYRVQNAGINMVLLEVYLHISVQVMIIIPFNTEPEKVQTELPVSYVLISGDVPQYYFDNKGNPVGDSSNAPNIALPGLNTSTTSMGPSNLKSSVPASSSNTSNSN